MGGATIPSRELTVRERPVSELIPSPQNARTHTQRQIEQIKASIMAFGFHAIQPLIRS